MYERTIAASPDSPFLYRELAIVEKREGNLAGALEHAQKAATLNPTESRNFTTIGEIYEAQAEYDKALEAYTTAAALEPNEAIESKIDDLRERAAFAAMPDEYRSIEKARRPSRARSWRHCSVFDSMTSSSAPRVRIRSSSPTREAAGQLRGSFRPPAPDMMEVYPNHTFQPNAPGPPRRPGAGSLESPVAHRRWQPTTGGVTSQCARTISRRATRSPELSGGVSRSSRPG